MFAGSGLVQFMPNQRKQKIEKVLPEQRGRDTHENRMDVKAFTSQGNGGRGAELEVAATEIQSNTSQGLLN